MLLMVRKSHYLLSSVITCLTFISTLDAYDYKKHIPEEYRQFLTDNDQDDKNDVFQKEEHYGPFHLADKKVHKLKINGPASLEHVKVKDNLIVNGPATLENVDVNKNLIVHGPLDSINCTIHTLDVMGPVSMRDSVIKKKAKIYGPLDAVGTKFEHTIEIASDSISLEDTKAHAIRILKNSSKRQKPQKLILKGNSIIHSDITFESGHGIVIVSKNATIKGKVKGAKVEYFG